MGEYWDVTDEDGVPTGDVHRRGSPGWPAGRFHVVAATCLLREDGAVLLTQRAAHKEFPLTWEFPGGSALAGESSEAAATRELREETGVIVPVATLKKVGRVTEASALIDLYVARTPVSCAVRADPSEVVGYQWARIGEVAQRLQGGMMAEPWTGRLRVLWNPLVEVLESAR